MNSSALSIDSFAGPSGSDVTPAAAVMAEEASRFGITHAGFAMTSSPRKRIEEPLWCRRGHRTVLLVEPGRAGKGGSGLHRCVVAPKLPRAPPEGRQV